MLKKIYVEPAWWCHQMENFFALLALLALLWPVNSSHKGQWRGALIFSLICAWTNSWINNWDAGDLRCHCTYYDVTVMCVPADSHQHIITLISNINWYLVMLITLWLVGEVLPVIILSKLQVIHHRCWRDQFHLKIGHEICTQFNFVLLWL